MRLGAFFLLAVSACGADTFVSGDGGDHGGDAAGDAATSDVVSPDGSGPPWCATMKVVGGFCEDFEAPSTLKTNWTVAPGGAVIDPGKGVSNTNALTVFPQSMLLAGIRRSVSFAKSARLNLQLRPEGMIDRAEVITFGITSNYGFSLLVGSSGVFVVEYVRMPAPMTQTSPVTNVPAPMPDVWSAVQLDVTVAFDNMTSFSGSVQIGINSKSQTVMLGSNPTVRPMSTDPMTRFLELGANEVTGSGLVRFDNVRFEDQS